MAIPAATESTGFVAASRGLDAALSKVDLHMAIGALVRSIKLVREDLVFRAALRTIARKGA